MPRSLYGRLLLLSLAATLAALAMAGVAIGGILERFVTAGLDDRLDAEIAVLSAAIRPDGSVDPARTVVAAPYADAASGWAWRIDGPRGGFASPGGQVLTVPMEPPRPPDRPGPPRQGPDGARPFDWRDAGGEVRHGRSLLVATASGPVRIVAAAPRAIVRRPIRAAMAPLIGSLAALGAVLTLATLVQLRLGLQPLARLRDAVAAIRAGMAERLPGDQPEELQPLVDELNALVEENATRLRQARGHVANLAHGLKTPLATLSLDLADGAADPDGRLRHNVARIDAAIRHHLGRARADAAGAGREAVTLAPTVAALAAALIRIHADRAIAFTAAIASDMVVAADAQDLDEILGNLLDNAWRHARTAVSIVAERDGAWVCVRIVDDGLGIPAAARAEAMRPGRRLDEAGDGHGFGLSIARELTELHGGTLALNEAPGGGLAVAVRLPAGRV